MIVKMKKVTLLVSKKHQESALNALRKLGVLHIKNLKQPACGELTILEQEISDLDKTLAIISNLKAEQQTQPEEDTETVQSYMEEAISLENRRQINLAKLEELQAKLEWFNLWGDISKACVEELNKNGIFIRLYIFPKKDLENLLKDRFIFVIKEDKSYAYVAIISQSKEQRLEYKQEEIPSISLAEVNNIILELKYKTDYIRDKLAKFSTYKAVFVRYRERLVKEVEFHKAKHGMLSEEVVCWLEGFCPEESARSLVEAASDNGWGYIGRKPDDPSEVPTLIRNPRWLKIINPVFKFMGTVPGYNEFDISLWFLFFFGLFFAMIIGDAGYGVILLLLSLFARRKFKDAAGEPFILLYVLSTATIIWGAATGVWFGYEKIAKLPFFNAMVIGRINSFVDGNQIFMMYLCFIIGLIHLSIAHLILAFKIINSVVALAQLGWIAILSCLFFIAGNLVLDKPVPSYASVLFIAGALAVVLFSNPQKNILKGIAVSLADLPLKVISSFSDIVSYIRLFAVGTATVVVAQSFNEMALGFGMSSVLSGLIAALILFAGHTLNILLGLMSVVVHGIRLNMLEFSGHLNMQWMGKTFRPFRE